MRSTYISSTISSVTRNSDPNPNPNLNPNWIQLSWITSKSTLEQKPVLTTDMNTGPSTHRRVLICLQGDQLYPRPLKCSRVVLRLPIWEHKGAVMHVSAPSTFIRSCSHFFALKVQLVVLVSAFVMVSTVWSVFCLLFFYSRYPPVPSHLYKWGKGHIYVTHLTHDARNLAFRLYFLRCQQPQKNLNIKNRTRVVRSVETTNETIVSTATHPDSDLLSAAANGQLCAHGPNQRRQKSSSCKSYRTS